MLFPDGLEPLAAENSKGGPHEKKWASQDVHWGLHWRPQLHQGLHLGFCLITPGATSGFLGFNTTFVPPHPGSWACRGTTQNSCLKLPSSQQLLVFLTRRPYFYALCLRNDIALLWKAPGSSRKQLCAGRLGSKAQLFPLALFVSCTRRRAAHGSAKFLVNQTCYVSHFSPLNAA